MKKLLLLLFITALVTTACKKSESEKSNIVTLSVTGVTSGSYSVDIFDTQSNDMLLQVFSETISKNYQFPAQSGSEIRVNITSTGPYKAIFKYRGKDIGNSEANGDSKISKTVKIP